MLIWPMTYQGDERTAALLQRARDAAGVEREAMRETHGQVSLDRAPHQELRSMEAV